MKFTLIPSLEEVRELSKSYDRIPLSVEVFADMVTPMSLLSSVKDRSDSIFLLESVDGGEKLARYSFLGYNPKKILTVQNGTAKVFDNGKVYLSSASAVKAVRELTAGKRTAQFDYLPPFTGGGVGYIGYEAIAECEGIQFSGADITNLPDCLIMLFDDVIAFDHHEGKITLIANIDTNANVDYRYKLARNRIKDMYDLLNSPATSRKPNPEEQLEFISNNTKTSFMSKVDKAKEYIQKGDVKQVVPSQRFSVKMNGDLLNTYRALRMINPSPYMFYIAHDDIEIAGASPETLVRVSSDNRISTFPIAGTRRRGANKDEDDALMRELLADEKELAEHNMLVDFAKKEVSKISVPNSVGVKDYKKVEFFSHVMHITSHITATLDKSHDGLSALQALSPAGTLSGTPKRRAMEIIDELEGERRGLYGGAIGYFSYDGNIDTCIAIRTIAKKGSNAYIQTGCGVVKDSDAQCEYDETINKAKALFTAIEMGQEL